MRELAAELRKLATLPGVWIGMAAGLIPVAVTAYAEHVQAAQYGTPPSPDDGYFQLIGLGVVGAIIIGVIAVSSEYGSEDAESGGGRPITTALTVHPRRIGLLLAKLAAVGIVVTLLAAVATTLTLIVRALALDEGLSSLDTDELARGSGVIVYWVLTGWIAQGITLLTRSGIVPLAVLIVNSAAVPVTYLLSQAIPAAGYLPDRAGYSMVIRTQPTTVQIDPVIGGLVMVAWTVAIVAVAAVAFHRRDA